jgi:hypothetical protein
MIRVQPGDWVRFYQNGSLVIGVVEYVRPVEYDFLSHKWEIDTDVGSTTEKAVREMRRAAGACTGGPECPLEDAK